MSIRFCKGKQIDGHKISLKIAGFNDWIRGSIKLCDWFH